MVASVSKTDVVLSAMTGTVVASVSKAEIVLSAMMGNSGNICQQGRNSVVCYDGSHVNYHDGKRMITHGSHKKRAAAIRNIFCI